MKSLLERKFVDFYARSSNVPLDVAERDVVLTYVLKALSQSVLQRLCFKGGTCLKKLFFGNSGRFSMDLDFTSVGINVDELKKEVTGVLQGSEFHGLKFKITEEHIKEGVGKENESYLANVSYSHDWNSSEFLLEVSYRESPILRQIELPFAKEMYFKYLEFEPSPVMCLQKEELLAEKIRASFQRIRSRDLYDLYLFSSKSFDKVKLRKLVVLKCWNARDPFEPELLFRKITDEDYDWDDLQRLVRKKSLPTRATVVKKVLLEYSFLKDLDNNLQRIIKDSKAHRDQEFLNAFKKLK